MQNEIFERMPIHKAFFKLALPVVFSMVISLVYNMVDTWFIARTQNTDLVAGVSLCAPIFTLLIALGDIFGIGGSALVSRLFGQQELDTAKRVSSFCVYLTAVLGVCATIVMLVFRTPILHLLGASETTMSYATSYYTWLAVGASSIMLSIVPNNLLRTEGLAAQAMLGTILGSVVNILLDPIFIFTLGLGAGGAAIATVLSNALSVVVFLFMIQKKSQRLSISIKDIKVHRRQVQDICFIGLPASITNLMQSFAIMLTNRYLVSYGTEKVAALGIALKINMIIMLIMVGFAFGAQPLLGYNYGARNMERLRKIIRFELIVQVTFSAVSVLLFLAAAPQMIHIFMQDEAVITAGTLILRCLMMTAPFMGIILVFTTLFQAEGQAIPAFLLSVSRQGVVLLLCMVVLSKLFGYHGIVCAQAAADTLTMGMALLLYRKHRC